MLRVVMLMLFLFSIVKGETLKEVIKIAENKSPFLKSYLYEVESLKGLEEQAKALFNPVLNVGFGRLVSQTESGVALTDFAIRQRFRMWGERKFAINSAKFRKKAQEYFYQFQKNILLGQIYTAFFDALSQKEKIKIKEKEISTLKELHRYIKKSYELGESTPLDLLRVERDIELVSIQLENLKSRYKASLNTLSSVVGENISDVEGNFYSVKDLIDINLSNLPLIKYYDLVISSQEEAIKRQKALAKPQITIGFVAGEDEVDLGKYDFGIVLSSTVPIFYRNQGQVIRILYQKKSNIEKKKQKELEFKADLDSIKVQFKTLKKQLVNLRKVTIPKVKKALELADKSFKNRVISFFEYTSVRKQYFDTLLFEVELVNQMHRLKGEHIKIGGFKE